MIWLDAARVLSILAVVFLHVAGSVVVLSDFGSPGWWAGNFYDAMTRWCVPVLVMVSGALLLDTGKKEDILGFYRKRASRILLPIAFWSAVYIGWNHRAAIADIKMMDVVASLARGWPHYHLWFLFMIACLYLVVPFMRVLVVGARRGDLWWLVALAFLFAGINEAYRVFQGGQAGLFTNWFLSYLPYFLCGHLIRTSPWQPPVRWLVAGLAAAVAVTAVGCFLLGRAKGLDKGMYFYGYLSISVIPMSMGVMLLLKRLAGSSAAEGWLKRIAPLTLGAYLVHPMFLEAIREFLFKPESRLPLVSIPLLSILVFGASLAVAFIFMKLPVLKRTI